MDPDLFFVIGLVVAGLAAPSIISAFTEGRGPRMAVALLVIGGGMVAYAMNARPNAYGFDTIPDVFVRVIAQYIN